MSHLRCAAWNLRVGRPAETVAREVDDLLEFRRLDVLCVCEAGAYIPALRRRLKGRFKVATGRGPSGRDSAVITRKGMRTGTRRVHRLERQGWERKAGRPGLHHPRSMVSRPVQGIKFASVHLPPPGGPTQTLRKVALRAALSTVTRLGRRWSDREQRWVMAGDWNITPGSPEAQAVAVATQGDIVGSRIDWIMSHRVQVSDYQRINHGRSDHKPILFSVKKT